MKTLGNLSFTTKAGYVLIRSKNIPEIYSKVVTKDMVVVGKVADVIGPIMDPHIVVKPLGETVKNPEIIKGKELFELPPNKARDRRWKKRR